MSGFVAVHVGAGYHADNLRPLYKKTCKNACKVAVQLLQDQCNAVEAVSAAVAVLEDCPLTNAGIGSNLSITGSVECDAGIMDGASLNFGSVGALCNIKNPIKVAQNVLEEQNRGLLSHGRIPPCILVGSGALEWAKEHGFCEIDQKQLSTEVSRAVYLKNKSLLKKVIPSEPKSNFISDTLEQRSFGESTLLDTVGAVCVDAFGNVSSAVSSGGLLLKHCGRIGQASVYGSGCWAENSLSTEKPSIACSATGVGEYLIKTVFAKECCQMLCDNANSLTALPDVFRKKFLDSPYIRTVGQKLAGVLVLKSYSDEGYCELGWAHTTKTMILGYMNVNGKKPFAVVCAQPEGSRYGESIVGSEKCFKLS
ncbi:threonine aspartase 1-like [Stegodyphus dumicola]|uniref:threonine aspartase 1-like n=1 Tax=Stegodyphus dumicola TaxID=202533 RepID=UPI0015B16CCB|nr:threonine aspartase 1-like [Stegodyphus dumicola]XP_035214104.1 threonine aspartase 1-like [Stegodyphus dumicola]XP_035214105.1 threonine aspartase 1-like [Stegodyphus dumicola]XP_035214106.1 threonine aspartase 1-like [Stegodyphus dumicola]XP_035214107.1 threonine aspartase 1-like [Stegodyphus dumicola]XP_035214109.1 threonine aspartase 1-like [Stegodyphus dumicola]